MESKYQYLNLGCGSRFIESWVNIDFVSHSPYVIAHNLLNGIPLPDNSVDVVYHSHVLEHFPKDSADPFIRECYRVLKPGGIIRIAVPELEQLARNYIRNLENVLNDNSEINAANYQWSVIEMFDQMVRNYSGGEMGKYWTQETIVNEEYVTQRVGYEFAAFRKDYLERLKQPKQPVPPLPKKKLTERIKNRLFVMLFPSKIPNERQIEIGSFRTGGEIHQWMYDRYSLKMLLQNVGFTAVEQQQANTSKITNWDKFSFLDVENGVARKPDSLFMEAVKPA